MSINDKIKVTFQITGEKMDYLINLIDIVANLGGKNK